MRKRGGREIDRGREEGREREKVFDVFDVSLSRKSSLNQNIIDFLLAGFKTQNIKRRI